MTGTCEKQVFCCLQVSGTAHQDDQSSNPLPGLVCLFVDESSNHQDGDLLARERSTDVSSGQAVAVALLKDQSSRGVSVVPS